MSFEIVQKQEQILRKNMKIIQEGDGEYKHPSRWLAW